MQQAFPKLRYSDGYANCPFARAASVGLGPRHCSASSRYISSFCNVPGTAASQSRLTNWDSYRHRRSGTLPSSGGKHSSNNSRADGNATAAHAYGDARGGRGRSAGDPAGMQPYGRGAGGAPGGRGRSGSRPPADDDYPDLPSLAEAVEAHAQAWAASGRIRKLRAAFNKAPKLGMRPGMKPREADLARTALLCSVLGSLAEAYLPLVPRLRDPADCVLPLWACAKAGYWEGGLAAALMARLAHNGGELLQRAIGQDHSQLWWSLSEVPADVLAALPTAAVLRSSERYLLQLEASELGPQVCSNVLLAAARLRYSSPPLLQHVTASLAGNVSSADSQHLANAIYSLGKLAEECGHTPRQEDLQRLAGEVVRRLGVPAIMATERERDFIPQHFSNMLWGCAKLRYTDSTLLRPLVAAAGRAATNMEPQHLANSLYALAELGCRGAEFAPALKSLMEAMVGSLCERPEDFEPQHLSNTLWALAVLQPPGSQELVAAAAAECLHRGFAGFNAQDVSNATWALAKLAYGDQGWYAAAALSGMQPHFLEAAYAQGYSNLLYALAEVRHRPPAALLAGMAGGQQLRTQANAQACVNSLWALAILYGCLELCEASQGATGRLVDLLAERLGQLLRQPAGQPPNGQWLANSLWALVVMGPAVLSRHSGLVEGLLREAVQCWEAGRGEGAFRSEELTQLWQVQLELVHAGERASGILTGGSLLGAAQAATEADVREPGPTTSGLQRQVFRTLSRLQRASQQPGSEPAILSVQGEHWVAELCCRVDVVVELAGGRRVAVEVDGPIHFLANTPHTRVKDGPTQLRDRQLERVFGRGNVLSVPYWEWDGRGQAEHEEYLCSRLKA